MAPNKGLVLDVKRAQSQGFSVPCSPLASDARQAVVLRHTKREVLYMHSNDLLVGLPAGGFLALQLFCSSMCVCGENRNAA